MMLLQNTRSSVSSIHVSLRNMKALGYRLMEGFRRAHPGLSTLKFQLIHPHVTYREAT